MYMYIMQNVLLMKLRAAYLPCAVLYRVLKLNNDMCYLQITSMSFVIAADRKI
jgi:hypothetical protein